MEKKREKKKERTMRCLAAAKAAAPAAKAVAVTAAKAATVVTAKEVYWTLINRNMLFSKLCVLCYTIALFFNRKQLVIPWETKFRVSFGTL